MISRPELRRLLRERIGPAAVWFFVVWPLGSVLTAAWHLGEQPLIASTPWSARVSGTTISAVFLLAEWVSVGFLLLVANSFFWALAGRIFRLGRSRVDGWYEPVFFTILVGLGVVIVYPAQLLHPVFVLLREVPVGLSLLLLLFIAVGAAGWIGLRRAENRKRAAGFLASAMAVTAAVAAALLLPANVGREEGMRDSVLLLGLDSMSQTQDLTTLQRFAQRKGLRWYRHPVTPGLLTNSVWPAILMNRPVHQTGTYLTFQSPNWQRSPYNMVETAEKSGLETWSFFSDQFTTYVGSKGGFDVDRSGPKGWLQPGTAAVKDASLFLPVVLARLPRIPGARSPRNQSGTFAYDLDRELSEILTAGSRGRRVFVAAHLDYLHQPAYPGLADLTPRQTHRVMRAPVRAVRDLSLHWQYPPVVDDPLGIYEWKLRRLQLAVARAFDRHGVLDPEKGNRVAIFSDHGPRVGISNEDFSARHLYKVPLITTDRTGRDLTVPISLLDLHALVGLDDPTRPAPAPAAVEYVNVGSFDEEQVMMRSSTLLPDGEVRLHPYVIARFGENLRAYHPHEASRGYVPVPTVPAEMDRLGPD